MSSRLNGAYWVNDASCSLTSSASVRPGAVDVPVPPVALRRRRESAFEAGGAQSSSIRDDSQAAPGRGDAGTRPLSCNRCTTLITNVDESSLGVVGGLGARPRGRGHPRRGPRRRFISRGLRGTAPTTRLPPCTHSVRVGGWTCGAQRDALAHAVPGLQPSPPKSSRTLLLPRRGREIRETS